MSDKNCLKKTLLIFHKEANRLMRSNFDDCPLPFQRFLGRLESDTAIREYLGDCIDRHTPAGFSAGEEYIAVSSKYGSTFGPFSTIPEEESAQVYLILKELVAQNVQGHSSVFSGYCIGSKKFQDKYRGFLDDVARRLIDNVECHLSILGIDAGLDDSGDKIENNFNGPIGSAQINQPTGSAVLNATQNNGIDAQELNRILGNVITAAKSELDDAETLKDIEETLGSIRDQMMNEKPKRGVIRGAIFFLKEVRAGAQFIVALKELVAFLSDQGIPGLSLPQI